MAAGEDQPQAVVLNALVVPPVISVGREALIDIVR